MVLYIYILDIQYTLSFPCLSSHPTIPTLPTFPSLAQVRSLASANWRTLGCLQAWFLCDDLQVREKYLTLSIFRIQWWVFRAFHWSSSWLACQKLTWWPTWQTSCATFPAKGECPTESSRGLFSDQQSAAGFALRNSGIASWRVSSLGSLSCRTIAWIRFACWHWFAFGRQIFADSENMCSGRLLSPPNDRWRFWHWWYGEVFPSTLRPSSFWGCARCSSVWTYQSGAGHVAHWFDQDAPVDLKLNPFSPSAFPASTCQAMVCIQRDSDWTLQFSDAAGAHGPKGFGTTSIGAAQNGLSKSFVSGWKRLWKKWSFVPSLHQSDLSWWRQVSEEPPKKKASLPHAPLSWATGSLEFA